MRFQSRSSWCVSSLLAIAGGLAACSGDDLPLPPEGGGAPSAGSANVSGSTSAGVPGVGGASAGGASVAGAPVAGSFSQSGSFSLGGSGGAGSGGTGSAGKFGLGGSPTGAGGFVFGRGGSSGRGAGGASAGRGGFGSGTTGGGSGGGATATVAFSQVSAILTMNCGKAGCHAMGGVSPTLTGSMLHATLTTRTVARCSGNTLAKAGDTANSALVKLLNKQCGSFVMPPTCSTTPCLGAADVATITNWIQSGAKQQ